MKTGKSFAIKREEPGMAHEMTMTAMMPTFSLSAKDFPPLVNWKIGEKYKLEIEVENMEMSKNEYMEKQPITSRLKIVKITEEEVSEDESMAKKGRY